MNSKESRPEDLALVCLLEGALHDFALFNILMEYSIIIAGQSGKKSDCLGWEKKEILLCGIRFICSKG